MLQDKKIVGTGIGLRREQLDELKETLPKSIDFLEFAPENWMGAGGWRAKELSYFLQYYPAICHGLSLSIGGPAPLDETFILNIKKFLKQNHINIYSEHLSYCGDGGHLYDLFPIPFTEEAVNYVASRIQRVQELLERKLVMENISYYCAPGQEMQEIDFINAVIEKADCELLFDVNNVYVNSINHKYDPKEFIKKIPGDKIRYIHIAGHYKENENLLIDTHGADICPSVWELLEFTYQLYGVIPTLLERDNDVPPLKILLQELQQIKNIQDKVNANESKQAASG